MMVVREKPGYNAGVSVAFQGVADALFPAVAASCPPGAPLLGHLLAVGLGAMLGAWLRWGLSLWLNPLFPALPAGTLAANVGGGFLMGLALGWLELSPGISPALRLFLTTGFLGGLTTFSTYSAEVTGHLLRGQWGWAAAVALAHLLLTFAATLAGVGLYRSLA